MPHRCVDCKRIYPNLTTAQRVHPTCTMWSCSFLRGIQYAVYPVESKGRLKALCCYCTDSLGHGQEGRIKSAVLRGHMRQHSVRNCNQGLYFSGQSFRQHLQDDHRAVYDGTLFAAWTLLLKACRRHKPSVFQPVGTQVPNKRSTTASESAGNRKRSARKTVHVVPTSFMELAEGPVRSEPNKLRRKRSGVTLPEIQGQDGRQSMDRFTRMSDMASSRSTFIPPLPQEKCPSPLSYDSRSSTATTSLAYSVLHPSLGFYRRRIDASGRNRVYLHDDDEAFPDDTGSLFRKIPGGIFGGLILHSSLIAAVSARMTNSVDIYPLHDSSWTAMRA